MLSVGNMNNPTNNLETRIRLINLLNCYSLTGNTLIENLYIEKRERGGVVEDKG